MPTRPRCSVFIAASLDGMIARPDGGIDWLDRVALPDEDYGFAAFFASVDALVMGRGTYDKARSFDSWPYEGKHVVVLTHRPAAPHPGVTFLAGFPQDALVAVATAVPGARRIYVDGGDVIAQFLAAGLIDDLTISVIPIVLGAGLRLFPGGHGAGEHALVLDLARSWASGLVQLRYRTLPGA